MKKKYTKEHKSLDEQLELLAERGLLIEDRIHARRVLLDVGYYHFGTYLYPMRKTDSEGRRLDEFQPGASFVHAASICHFDHELRHLCLEALQRFERALKVAVALTLGKDDKFFHHTGSAFRPSATRAFENGTSKHGSWLARHQKAIKVAKGPIREFRRRYSPPLPIWVAVEVMQFGDLTALLDMLEPQKQDLVAAPFGIAKGSTFASWSQTLREVRNMAAHHERIWNRKLTKRPRQPTGPDARIFSSLGTNKELRSHIYAVLLIMSQMMRALEDQSKWAVRTRELLGTFPTGLGGTLHDLGVPSGWEDDPMWADLIAGES